MTEVAAISGTRRQIRELIDGTLELKIHIEPRFKHDFHSLFPEIDMPIAIAPLNLNRGNGVMVSTSDFDSDSEGSSPSSPANAIVPLNAALTQHSEPRYCRGVGGENPSCGDPHEDKPKGGELARLAGMFCNNASFTDFRRQFMATPLGETEAECNKRYICETCRVISRAELDHNEEAQAIFHKNIRIPFSEQQNKGAP